MFKIKIINIRKLISIIKYFPVSQIYEIRVTDITRCFKYLCNELYNFQKVFEIFLKFRHHEMNIASGLQDGFQHSHYHLIFGIALAVIQSFDFSWSILKYLRFIYLLKIALKTKFDNLHNEGLCEYLAQKKHCRKQLGDVLKQEKPNYIFYYYYYYFSCISGFIQLYFRIILIN